MMRGVLTILLGLSFSACQNAEETNTYLQRALPAHFPTISEPEHNLSSEVGIRLGEMLFFDPVLSGDGTVSCASCHFPTQAFSDTVAFSVGISGKPSLRNSPPLFNLAWHKEFFHDGGGKNLESQTFGPIQHPDELGARLRESIATIQAQAHYREAFQAAFGSDTVTSAGIARALAQFQRSLISADSKYDRWMQGVESLNSLELAGLKLFESHCAGCHHPPLFTDLSYHNIGLNSHYTDDYDGIFQGRFRISYDSADLGAFKTPSLRNLAYTSPYMHDGRFQSLEEVLDHYEEGILGQAHLQGLLPKNPIQLSQDEQNALLAFLATLNDHDFALRSQSK